MNESFAVFGLAHFLRNQVRGDTGARVWHFLRFRAALLDRLPIVSLAYRSMHVTVVQHGI